MKDFIKKNRSQFILVALAVIAIFSLIASFAIRFEFTIPPEQSSNLRRGLLLVLLVKMSTYLITRMHRGWWSYVGIGDLLRTFTVSLTASILFWGTTRLVIGPSFPRGVIIIDFLVGFILIAGMRLIIQIQRQIVSSLGLGPVHRRVLIYGAGWAGANLARELQLHTARGYRILGFIEDDPAVRREGVLLDVPILGGREKLKEIVDKFDRAGTSVDEILIAMPSASNREMRAIISACQETGAACKMLPNLEDLLSGRELSTQVRAVSLEDLLGRDPVELDETRLRQNLQGRVVLVTGAAGSIGSELCRQIAPFQPAKIVVLDQAESPLFFVELELRERFPKLRVVPSICDIRDLEAVRTVMRNECVEMVFHAAAYKHVPLMEANVVAAIQNNVIGSWNLARASMELGVRSFLMISSDKAVNPCNVMGATKRAAELIVGSCNFDAESTTSFVSVRFGNVLGSNGSVVPLFESQIKRGGPVTVTHPEVRRYFMLTREAVQLVLQASTMGKGGEIFVLEMGDPVRIVDLARNMIRLSGFVPDKDIAVEFTGLRPGEKLYEEVLTKGESILPTYHEKIKIFRGPLPTPSERDAWLAAFQSKLAARDEAGTVILLQQMIPEYVLSPFWLERLPAAAGQFVDPPEPVA